MKPYGNYRKLYEALRRYDSQQAAVQSVADLAEIAEIWRFYEKLSADELRLIGAAIKKTEAQLGYIPFCFSTIPFVFLIFSAKLSTMIPFSFIMLILAIATLAAIAIWLIHRHFTHKSYNALHLHIVEALLEQQNQAERERRQRESNRDEPKDEAPPLPCTRSASSP